jgi:2,5-furandicarboxylate decarboxylase 1
MAEDLRGFLEELQAAQQILEIKEELSTTYEIPAAIKEIDKRLGKAVYFSHVQGYPIPIIANLLGQKKRLALALGINEEILVEEYLRRRNNPIKPTLIPNGPIKDVIVHKDINISKTIPVLTHHQKDVSPYFTSAVTMAKDPETGIRGMGLHRIQIKDNNTIGIFLATPPLSHFLKKAEERNQPLDIAIAVGMDPLTYFASVIWAPEGIDKFDIAGGLKGSPVKLVKAESVDLEIPAEAEFVLEGQIIPHQRDKEGPFGESTGYYFSFHNPVGKIKLISHRKNPIYHALMPFSTEESVLLDLSWELDNLKNIQSNFPNVVKMHLKSLGELMIIQIAKKSEEDASKLFQALFPTNPFVKLAIAVDPDVDIYDLQEVAWAVATRFRPDRDLTLMQDMPGMMIDPSTGGEERTEDLALLITKTAKMGIDATKPLTETDRYEKIDVPGEVKERIANLIKKYI